MLSCLGCNLARGPSQRRAAKYLEGFTVLGVNSELEETRGPNP
jgi:hypothetical protein